MEASGPIVIIFGAVTRVRNKVNGRGGGEGHVRAWYVTGL